MPGYFERACVLAENYSDCARRRCPRWPFIAKCIAIFGLLLPTAYAQTKTTFDIDAGPAAQSLNLYAQQARVQLGFSVDVVGDIRTNPVKGEYETTEALELLLAGTGLEAERGDKGIIIHHAAALQTKVPTTNAASLQFNQTTAQAAPERLTTSGRANNGERDKPKKPLEEILVTGSRIRGAQNSSPVVTITRSDIDNAGFSTVEQLVESLPQNFGGGANQENFSDNFGPASVRNRQLSGSEVSIDLRGLGPDSTLVLLNGRRLAQAGLAGSFVDVSSIPLSAIERIEVLTDGASAIYGADAIAGRQFHSAR